MERRAVEEATSSAGAREVFVIHEPFAAISWGAGIQVGEASGSMIVDMGGYLAEVTVISPGGVVISKSIRSRGTLLDDAIATFRRKNYGLIIGEQTAEQIKLTIGAIFRILPGQAFNNEGYKER